jgi:hypothetical protein
MSVGLQVARPIKMSHAFLQSTGGVTVNSARKKRTTMVVRADACRRHKFGIESLEGEKIYSGRRAIDATSSVYVNNIGRYSPFNGAAR